MSKESINEQTLSVSIHDLNKLKATKGLLPLSCYAFNEVKEDWEFREFPRTKTSIFLSSRLSEDLSSSELEEGYYISLFLLANFWFINNKQDSEKCLFNGIHKRHQIVTSYSSAFVEMGESKLILTNRQASTFQLQNKNQMKGMPGTNEYAVKTPLGIFRYPIHKTVLIGANPACDVIIKGAPFAAMIFVYRGDAILIKLGTDPVKVNGTPVMQKLTNLKDNDSINVGIYTLQLYFPENCVDPMEKEVAEDQLCLIPIKTEGGDFEKCFVPQGYTLTIGSAEDNDIVLYTDGVSRHHAQLTISSDGQTEVVDCNSTNGSFVNNKKIDKEVAEPGSILSFGPANYLLGFYH